MRTIILATFCLMALPAVAETWTCRFQAGGPEGRIPQVLTIKLDPDWGTAQVTDPNLAPFTDVPMEGTYETPTKAQRKVTWKTPMLTASFEAHAARAYVYSVIYFPASRTAVISFTTPVYGGDSDGQGRADGACNIEK